MKTHRNWAVGTGIAILLVAIWSFRTTEVSNMMIAASLVLAGLVGATGYLGSELVYRHGLGVMRLPATTGEGHDHAGGGDHSHDKTETAPIQEATPHEHGEGEGHEHAAEATISPAGVAAALSAAIKSGDHETVSALMADDVLILEGGHAQASKADYMSGHMLSDMAFLAGIDSELISQDVGLAGDTAWVVTHSRMRGSYKEKPIDMPSREFLLMRKSGADWKIIQVQWDQK